MEQERLLGEAQSPSKAFPSAYIVRIKITRPNQLNRRTLKIMRATGDLRRPKGQCAMHCSSEDKLSWAVNSDTFHPAAVR